MPKEIETKFKLLSGPRLRTVLRKKGYKFVSKEFESDVYYESPGRNVRDMVVRLRRGRGKGGLFTVKLPGTGKDKRFKVRDEFETCVQDAGRFDEILKALGFKIKFRKEKFRETYRYGRCLVLLDLLPSIGWYMEIEGSKKDISAAAGKLGFSMKDASSDNYMSIYKKHLGIPARNDADMIFPSGKRSLK